MANRKKPQGLIRQQTFGRKKVVWKKSKCGTHTITEYSCGNPRFEHVLESWDEAGEIFMDICEQMGSEHSEALMERIRMGFHQQRTVTEEDRVLKAYRDYGGDLDKICMSTGVKKRRVREILHQASG